MDPYLGSHKVDIRPAWEVRYGYLSTRLLSSNGLGYHGETGSLWYGRIAQLVRAFGICPEGPGFNSRSGHFYKFNSFDYRVDVSIVGQTFRLQGVCGVCINWDGHFDCGVCASTLGWTVSTVGLAFQM